MTDLYKKAPKNKVAFPFDLNTQPPFLKRELSTREKRLMRLWLDFYKMNIADSAMAISEFRTAFSQFARKAGFSTQEVGGKGNPGSLLRDCFTDKEPKSTWVGLLAIMGMEAFPNKAVLKSLFRGVVTYHQELNGDQSLPTASDFKRYHDAEIYIPEAGLFLPAYHSFKRLLDPPRESLRDFYGACFEPGELDSFQLREATNLAPTLEELVENYRKCNQWIHETRPDIGPEMLANDTDIDNYATIFNGWSWNDYESFFANYNSGNIPNDEKLNLGKIRELAGLNSHSVRRNGIRKLGQRPWTAEEAKESFKASWKAIRPSDFQPLNGRLRNPPTRTELSQLKDKQAKIVGEHGELDAAACREANVPTSRIADLATIRNVCKPYGLIGLLRQIEDEARFGTRIEMSDRQRSTMLRELKKLEIPATRTPFFLGGVN